MRVTLKILAFAFCLLCFFLTTLPLYPWLQLDAKRVRPLLIHLTSFAARFMVMVLGLKVKVSGEVSLWKKRGGHLIVANHMSYLDVILLAASRPTSFVTSVEIKRSLGLGQITQLAGCLFVNRQDRRSLVGEVSELAEALRAGLDVVVFPEATSTNGEALRRFKRPLFNAALKAQVPVLPVTINYLSANGERLTAQTRDALCWYGDMDFIPHFMALCRLKSAELSLHIETPISEVEHTDTLTATAFERVSRHFKPLLEGLV
jgi:1-acyl-sn-glycerol-3-phosphate acyltransferase